MPKGNKDKRKKRMVVQEEQGREVDHSTEEDNSSYTMLRIAPNAQDTGDSIVREESREGFPIAMEETKPSIEADKEEWLRQVKEATLAAEQEFAAAALKEQRNARWEKMTVYAIVLELGWSFAEVNKIFKGDRSVGSNLFIKKKIIEGWKPLDGIPEIKSYIHENILVVEAWTFSLAIKKAIESGLKWDRGHIFRWVKPHREIESQLITGFNIYELRTVPTLLEQEFKQAKEFSPPYAGNIYQFKSTYNGSFAVYKNKVVKRAFAAAQSLLPEKIFLPFVKRGLVNSPETGVNLRSVPYNESAPEIKDNPTLIAAAKQGFLKNIPFNTRLDILKKSDDHWYYVRTEFGDEGYVVDTLVEINLPDPQARYYLVQKGDTALGIALKFYSSSSKESVGVVEKLGEDFRNYVLKLAEVNKGGGVKIPISDVNNKDSWASAQVYEGLRIWIPSAAGMYELIQSTSSDNLHGQRWVKDSLQTFVNATPNSLIINTFLAEWRRIPKEQREAKLHDYASTGAAFLTKLTYSTPLWLDTLLVTVKPELYGIKSLTTLVHHFIIGYLERMATLDPTILVNNLERFLENLTSAEYLAGLVMGTIDGVKGWFVDLWEMVKGIISIAGEIFNIKENIHRLGKLGPIILQAAEYIKNGEGDFLKFIAGFNPLDLLQIAEDGLKAGGKKLGGLLAESVISFTGQSPYGMGHAIGVLMGYVIPELLLAYFSAGISAGAKAAVKTFRVVFDGIISPIMKGARVILSSVQEALSAVRLLLKHVSNYVAMLIKSGRDSKLGKMIQEMLEGIENFLKGKADEAIEEGLKKGDELPGVKKVDEVVDSKKVGQTETDKALEEGGVKKDDPDYGEKMKVLIKAKAATEAADALPHSPYPSILINGILNPILTGYPKLKEKNVHFEAHYIAPNHWSIWMIGSEIKIDDDYESDGKDKLPEEELGKDKDKSEIEKAKVSKPSYKIGESDGGPGEWGIEKESTKYKDFERKVSGAPQDDLSYKVLGPNDKGYVKFDGYDPSRNVLLDAKDFNNFPKIYKGKIIGKENIIAEAERQLAAYRKGVQIEWHVASEEHAIMIRELLSDKKLPIKVVFPPKFL